MKDNNFFISSSIGNRVIFKDPINVLEEIAKNMDWTDNKIYKDAAKVQIVRTTEVSKNNSQTEDLQLLGDLERLRWNAYVEQNKVPPKVSNFTFYKSNLPYMYKENEDKILSEMEGLKKLILDNLHLDENETSFILDLKPGKQSKEDMFKLISMLRKYKLNLLKLIQYHIMDENEEKQLRRFLESSLGEPAKVNHPFDQRTSRNSDFNLFHSGGEDLNRMSSGEIKDQEFIMTELIKEFRELANDLNVSDVRCLDLIMKHKNNLKEALKEHFINKYNCEYLDVVFILPKNDEKTVRFNLMSDSGDLFSHTFILCPELDMPQIYYQGRKFEVDVNKVKYIGSLNLAQNARLTIKS